jgi:hypothetical protein
MEKKQNKLLLASAVIGALFVVGVIILWVFILKEDDFSIAVLINRLKDRAQDKIEALLLIGVGLSMVSVFLSFIFNLIGWIKGNNRHILVAGILYVLGFNLLSATLCFVEHFDEKRKIKNKLLFYTMIYTFIFGVFLIALLVISATADTEIKAMVPFWIYFVSTVNGGVILNFIAWKTGNNKAKIVAGIVYVLGIYTLISGIICFVSGRDLLKAIKNKLLFYAMVFALIIIVSLTVTFLDLGAASFEKDMLPFWIWMLPMTIAGFIINYFAWKTNNKKTKIIAGIVYIFGGNILSAILCFISCKNNRKLPTVE